MEDIQEQLAALRRRVARIDRKYAAGAAPGADSTVCREHPAAPFARLDEPPARYFIEELMSGEVVRTAHGEHFETEKIWERHRRHGSVEIADLAELPEDLLESLSAGTVARAHPLKWAFLDTETTGLAGGTGTYAFLVGVGSIDAEGFCRRPVFLRD